MKYKSWKHLNTYRNFLRIFSPRQRDKEDKEGTLSVDYGNITALLIEAIKEQQKQIDELKALIKK